MGAPFVVESWIWYSVTVCMVIARVYEACIPPDEKISARANKLDTARCD
jgi:hypothetical protein